MENNNQNIKVVFKKLTQIKDEEGINDDMLAEINNINVASKEINELQKIILTNSETEYDYFTSS